MSNEKKSPDDLLKDGGERANVELNEADLSKVTGGETGPFKAKKWSV